MRVVLLYVPFLREVSIGLWYFLIVGDRGRLDAVWKLFGAVVVFVLDVEVFGGEGKKGRFGGGLGFVTVHIQRTH